MADLTYLLQSSGVNLEAQAYKMFGAAVADAASGTIGAMFGDKPAPAPGNPHVQLNPVTPMTGIWDEPKYAAQLASNEIGSSSAAPKLKFLFKISFAFFPDLADYINQVAQVDISSLTRDIDFPVKSIDLPSVDFEYEEVNMYNFRTKVLKSIKHRDINLAFFDDVANNALNLMNIYRTLLIPIARKWQYPDAPFQDYGLSTDNTPSALNSSNRAVLPNDRINILDKITIHQFYVDMASKQPVKVNNYIFSNPRFSSISAGDQSHEDGGTPNTVALSFDYDSLFMEMGQLAANNPHPPTSVLPFDLLADYEPGQRAGSLYSAIQDSPGNTRNPFVTMLGSAAQQITQAGLNGIISKSIGSGIFGRSLSNAENVISGSLGQAAKRTLNNLASGSLSGISLPSIPLLSDNSASASSVTSSLSSTASKVLGDLFG